MISHTAIQLSFSPSKLFFQALPNLLYKILTLRSLERYVPSRKGMSMENARDGKSVSPELPKSQSNLMSIITKLPKHPLNSLSANAS